MIYCINSHVGAEDILKPLDLSGNKYYEVRCQAKDVKPLSRHDSMTFIDTDHNGKINYT